MTKLLLATRNAHKTVEFAQILGPEFLVLDLSAIPDAPEVDETGSTFEENAMLKAAAASHLTSMFVVGDDSGLEVAALGGAPGVRSARYAGERASDAENIAKLLAELRHTDHGSRADARFCCVLALFTCGRFVESFRGEIEGEIIDQPKGSRGFGYDPIFRPAGFDLTFAQLPAELKNEISHRAKAIKQLRAYLAAMPGV